MTELCDAAGPAARSAGRTSDVDRLTSHAELARSLIALEMSDTPAGLSGADAAQRVCRKLLDRLAKLITSHGSEALLARALHLARDLRAARGIPPDEVDSGLVLLLGLVSLFIGEPIMARVLLEIWPELPADTLARVNVRR